MNKATALQIIRNEIMRLDPEMVGEEESETFRVAVVVLSAACLIGADVDDLVLFTHYPWDFIRCISERMRKARLWGDGYTISDWYSEEGGVDRICLAGFWLHVLVAEGLLAIVEREDGQRAFVAV